MYVGVCVCVCVKNGNAFNEVKNWEERCDYSSFILKLRHIENWVKKEINKKEIRLSQQEYYVNNWIKLVF